MTKLSRCCCMWSDLLPVAFGLQFLVMELDSISVCEAECEVRG